MFCLLMHINLIANPVDNIDWKPFVLVSRWFHNSQKELWKLQKESNNG